VSTSDVFFGRAGVQYDASRCVRTLNRFAACERCVHACPTQALRAGSPPTFDAQACRSCGLCLHICPNGAFSGEDGVKLLYDTVAQLRTATSIELACHHHPSPAAGAAGIDAVVRADHCLAAFGPSVYLGLLGLARESEGAEATTKVTHSEAQAGEAKANAITTPARPRISVRLDACPNCPLSAAQAGIAQTIAESNALAEAAAHEQPFATITTTPSPVVLRTVIDAKPQLSRRQLFTALSGGGRRLLSGSLLPETPPKGIKTPPPERQRLIAALKYSPSLIEVAPENLPFASLIADDQCSACGVCARVCPTGALAFRADRSDQYRLTFKSAACTACGICINLCEPGALHRTGMPRLAELTAESVVTLREGHLRRCERCGTKFDAPAGIRNCPVCEWRKRHPFGSRPPAMSAKLTKTHSGE
jgi:formate hydrogenlyase subunit 6/NADH:ubiquinone oxidoreductase subunit I